MIAENRCIIPYEVILNNKNVMVDVFMVMEVMINYLTPPGVFFKDC